jgi:hypothetical protein
MEAGTMRSTWTDSRLDELNDRVKGLDEKVDAGFVRLDDRIDRLQHTIMVVGGGLFAAFVAFLAAIIGLIVTLLIIHA